MKKKILSILNQRIRSIRNALTSCDNIGRINELKDVLEELESFREDIIKLK